MPKDWSKANTNFPINSCSVNPKTARRRMTLVPPFLRNALSWPCTVQSWIWRQQFALKRRYRPTTINGIMVQNPKTLFFCHGTRALGGPEPTPCRGFTVKLRHTVFSRTPLDEWSARHRNLYLTTHNTHKVQISVPPARFEPTVSASERPQTHALDRTATEIGYMEVYSTENSNLSSSSISNAKI